ncbi:hypothetical protein HXT30_01625 [Gardnerella sp. DNF00571G]|uniref:hypothetical protein n=1 Tax=Gardnerella sp. DNF00571G TaxID=2749052 RepID=UPI003BB1D7DD
MREEKVRVCANKNCQKVLPPGYRHRYCEACRNKQAEKVKGALKGLGAAAGTVAAVAVALVTSGKIGPKNKND